MSSIGAIPWTRVEIGVQCSLTKIKSALYQYTKIHIDVKYFKQIVAFGK